MYVIGGLLVVCWIIFGGSTSSSQQYTLVWITIVSSFTGSLDFYTWDFVQINNQRYTANTGVRIVLSANDSSYYTVSGDIDFPLFSWFASGTYSIVLSWVVDAWDGIKYLGASLTRSGALVEYLNLDPLHFILDTTAPQQVLLTSPLDNAILYWARDFVRGSSIDSGVGIRYYTYSIATDSGMNDIVFANTTTQTWFSTNVNALWSGTYYRMVSVEDHLWNYSNSAIWTFDVDVPVWWWTSSVGESSSSGPSPHWYTMFDYCPYGDFSSSYYDGVCSASDWVNTHPSAGDTCVWAEIYGEELCLAYQYAFDNGITSMWSIDDALLYEPLLRKDFAKMVSQFAVHVVWLEPSVNSGCVFNDVADESTELKWFMKLSCELWLMWLHYDWSPNEQFWPNLPVSRAMFGTVLSRLLFGSVYNGNSESRYQDHLEALKHADIMKYIDTPLDTEKRGYAMLMLKRADEFGYVQKDAWRVSRYKRK